MKEVKMPLSPKLLRRRDSNDSARQLIDIETLSSSRENSVAASPSPDGTEVSTERSSLPELSSPEHEESPTPLATPVAEDETNQNESETSQAENGVPASPSTDYDPITTPLPPSYQEAVRGWKLTYVDFGPRCISVGGILAKPQFEKFDTLVCRANRWLKRNCDLRLRSIETLDQTAPSVKEGQSVDTHHVVRRFNAQDRYHFRVLRLWLVPRSDCDAAHDVQQVGYLNIMPACTKPGGISKKATFDTLDVTIEKYNKLMENRPLPGIVLAVDTLKVKYCEWRELPDPDSCFWSEHYHFRTSFLQTIRIYYISGPPTKEIIGWKDFDPKPIRDSGSLPSGMLPGPRYEGAETLLSRGRNWLVSDDSVRLTNIQTLDNKLRKGRYKKDKDVLISETPIFTTWYLHSLRFYYVRELRPPKIPNHNLFAHMTVRSFFPRQEAVVSFVSRPEEETMTATMNNVSGWLEAYPGTWIVGVESLEAQCSGRRSNLRQSHSNFIMYGVRLYSTKMFSEESNDPVVQMDEDDFSDSDWESILNARPDEEDVFQSQESQDTLGATPIVCSRQTTSDGSTSKRISVSSSVHFAEEPVVFE